MLKNEVSNISDCEQAAKFAEKKIWRPKRGTQSHHSDQSSASLLSLVIVDSNTVYKVTVVWL